MRTEDDVKGTVSCRSEVYSGKCEVTDELEVIRVLASATGDDGATPRACQLRRLYAARAPWSTTNRASTTITYFLVD